MFADSKILSLHQASLRICSKSLSEWKMVLLKGSKGKTLTSIRDIFMTPTRKENLGIGEMALAIRCRHMRIILQMAMEHDEHEQFSARTSSTGLLFCSSQTCWICQSVVCLCLRSWLKLQQTSRSRFWVGYEGLSCVMLVSTEGQGNARWWFAFLGLPECYSWQKLMTSKSL